MCEVWEGIAGVRTAPIVLPYLAGVKHRENPRESL